MSNDNQYFDIEEEIFKAKVMNLINSICHLRNVPFDQVYEEMKNGKSIFDLMDDGQKIVRERFKDKNITQEQMTENNQFIVHVEEVLEAMKEKLNKNN